jgi:hypothetical protein
MSDETKAIIDKISNSLPTIRTSYNVKYLGVFGSTARGQQTINSDVDLLVDFSKPVGFFAFIRLENHLSKLLNKKVDLVSRQGLKPSIKEDILKEVIDING